LTSLIAVTMTTAPSAAAGRLRNSGVNATSVITTRTAATSPATCERAPLAAAAKLRESLPFAGKPWKSPAARLLPLSARNSRFGRIASRSRTASACAVRKLLA
jgi:hypothetical protein